LLSSDDLRFIAQLLRQDSLAAASRALGVTPSAVTQRLQGLEARLGVRLVERSTRRAVPTSEGELLLGEAEAVLERLDALADRLHERSGKVSGELRVQAPFGFGRHFVAQMAGEFSALNPQLRISLTLSERPARALQESHDLTVHIGALRDSSMIGFRLAENARLACAAPGYLRARGIPRTPADLIGHACLARRENDEEAATWRFKGSSGVQKVRIAPAMTSNDGEVVRDWALAGLGIAVRSEWDVAPLIASGRLVRVLEGYALPEAPVMALVPARRGQTVRCRAFVEFMRARLAQPPWRRRAAPARRKPAR
jgi:DNA-binding transcriptional LysR family regulator